MPEGSHPVDDARPLTSTARSSERRSERRRNSLVVLVSPPFMRRAWLSLISVALGTLIAFLAMEAVLRFLPVNEGARP